MKTITSFIAILLISCFTISAQKGVKGNGNEITKNRSVGDFDEVSISGHFKIELKKGNEGDITLKGESNIIEYIETEVKDGHLKIKFKKGLSFRTHKTIHITIAFHDIEGISSSGSSDVFCDDEITAKALKLSLSGSGNFKMNVDTFNLTASISGSGNMRLTGKTDSFGCGISGSGNMNAEALASLVTTAKISGSGNVKVRAINEIHAKSSGSGNIIYYGDPDIVKATSSGSGSVQKRN